MIRYRIFVTLAALMSMPFLGSDEACAQWSVDPAVNNVVSNATGDQRRSRVVSDGAGGAIIVWVDYRNGNGDMYAQKFSLAGVAQWTVNGIQVTSASEGEDMVSAISDGAGGVILTWQLNNGTDNDIYAQRISGAGTVLWTPGGVPVCTATDDQDGPVLTTDGGGGAIIAWRDMRGGSNRDIYAQRVNSSGSVVWTANGVAVSSTTGDQTSPVIVSDETGGAILAWEDSRGADIDMYSQRLNSSGVAQWTANGVVISNAAANQQFPSIVIDGSNGALIGWLDGRNSPTFGIYCQRISSAGLVQWTANGELVSDNAVLTFNGPRLVEDGNGGAILVWESTRNGNTDVFAQKLTPGGADAWTADGVDVVVESGNQWNPVVIMSGSDAIVAWTDNARGNPWDVFAQKLASSGSQLWATEGVPITSATGSQADPDYFNQAHNLVSDGAGGAIVAWDDERGGTSVFDVYAQRVFSDGSLGLDPFLVTNTNDGGLGSLRAAIDSANFYAGVDTIRFHASLTGDTIMLSTPLTLDSIWLIGDVDGNFEPDITIAPMAGFDVLNVLNWSRLAYLHLIGAGPSFYMIRMAGVFSTVAGCRIGTNFDGTAASALATGSGIYVSGSYNTIGGLAVTDRNIISACALRGIFVRGNPSRVTLIRNNYIGTDISGTVDLGNTRGIEVDGSSVVTRWVSIGDGTANGRNLISGNNDYGVLFFDCDSVQSVGNYIGTDVTGTLAIPNLTAGIGIQNVTAAEIASGNVIAGNSGHGIVSFGMDTSIWIYSNRIGVGSGGALLPNTAEGVRLNGTGHFVGDGTYPKRNIIAGNRVGILVGSNQTRIAGNFIGLLPNGIPAVNNEDAIQVQFGRTDIQIGDTTGASARNYIAVAPTKDGIRVDGSSNVRIYNNYIGCDTTTALATGLAAIRFRSSTTGSAIGNGNASGRNLLYGTNESISLDSSDANWIRDNYLGVGADGLTPKPGSYGVSINPGSSRNLLQSNTIANMANSGIIVAAAAGTDSNRFYRNSIFNIGPMGAIEMAPPGNGGVAPPRITSLVGSTVSGSAAANALIQIYADSSDDARFWLDSTYATPGGAWTKTVVIPGGTTVRATQDSSQNTSELSAVAPSALLVTNTLDDFSFGSLRNAVSYANSNPGPDVITFDPGLTGAIISLGSDLVITDDETTIDGDIDGDDIPSITLFTSGTAITLQSEFNTIRHLNIRGSAVAVFLSLADSNMILENYFGTNLAGSDTLTGSPVQIGVALNNSSHNTIKGNVIANRKDVGNVGVDISGGRENTVIGNVIGSDISTTRDFGGYSGITNGSGSKANKFGDGTIPGRNFVCGASYAGVIISGGDSNNVAGNFIGLAKNGTTVIANNIGMAVRTLYNRIGIATFAGRNVVAGGGTGITMDVAAARFNTLAGNYVGLDSAGVVSKPVSTTVSIYGKYNRVGDGTIAGRNVISSNNVAVLIGAGGDSSEVLGNYIGVAADGTTGVSGTVHGIWVLASAVSIGNGTVGGRNVICRTSNRAMWVQGSYARILGNFVGLDATGLDTLRNNDGIDVDGGNFCIVGDGTVGGRNVVAGNIGNGIYVGNGRGNQVLGNYVGADSTGLVGFGNGRGMIVFNGSKQTLVGNGTAGGRNVIVGSNLDQGLRVIDAGTDSTFVLGNYIGLAADGSTIRANGNGITIEAGATHVWIGDGTSGGRNVISGNSNTGISIQTPGHIVTGNYIGTDATGLVDKGNTIAGISIVSKNNLIGTGLSGGGNVISGNDGYGLQIASAGSDSNTILGNIFGLGTNGATPIANNYGIVLQNGILHTKIGNGTALGRNVISSNTIYGVAIDPGSFTQILGNYIGVDAAGVNARGNGSGGVSISVVSGLARYNQIGDTLPGFGNVFAGSAVHVKISDANSDSNIVRGNTFGLRADGVTAVVGAGSMGVRIDGGASHSLVEYNRMAFQSGYGIQVLTSGTDSNRFYRNEIYSNTLGGVSLAAGTQGDIAAPRLTNVGSDSVVQGTGAPNTLIQIFSDSTNQGRNFLDTTYTQSDGTWMKKVALQAGLSVTAMQDSARSTSGFSIALGVPGALVPVSSITNFGTVTAGDSMSLAIRAVAVGGPINLSSLSHLVGTYFFTTDTSVSIPGPLAEGDTLTLTVKFKPTATTGYADTIRVVHDGLGGHADLILTGSGGAPVGTLVSDVSFGFANTAVGDSATVTLKAYSSGGPVYVSQVTQGIGGAVDFQVTVAPALPDTLYSGTTDTLFMTTTFRPLSAGVKVDTIKIYHNATGSPSLILLTGTGFVSNVPPNAFALKSPISNGWTNDATPTLSWQDRGDANGDALRYRIHVSSASNFSTLTVSDSVTGDSTYTVASVLAAGTWYWRVMAVDPSGETYTSSPGSFRVDVTVPGVTVGILRSTVIKRYLDVVGVFGETIQGLPTASAALTTSGGYDSVGIAMAAGSQGVYSGSYRLAETGTLSIRVSGSDSAGNLGSGSRAYAIGSLTKQQELRITHDGIELSMSRGSVSGESFVLLGSSHLKISVPTLSKGEGAMLTIVRGVDILSTETWSKPARVTVRLDEEIAELRNMIRDFDETKVGLYRAEDLVYVGGESSEGSLGVGVTEPGAYVVAYNPEHVTLPRRLELNQNYPNPFNPTTTIRFGLPESGRIRLTVYNMLGQKVAQLENGVRTAGYHTVVWNGRTDQGREAATGVYLYRLESPLGVVTRKMLLVK